MEVGAVLPDKNKIIRKMQNSLSFVWRIGEEKHAIWQKLF